MFIRGEHVVFGLDQHRLLADFTLALMASVRLSRVRMAWVRCWWIVRRHASRFVFVRS